MVQVEDENELNVKCVYTPREREREERMERSKIAEMSVKPIGACVQKQQMDWGAAERGGGTQPLFSLLSVCLRFCLSACLPTFLSDRLSVCLEMF